MTESQRVLIRQSEVREKIRILLEKSELSESEQTEKNLPSQRAAGA